MKAFFVIVKQFKTNLLYVKDRELPPIDGSDAYNFPNNQSDVILFLLNKMNGSDILSAKR